MQTTQAVHILNNPLKIIKVKGKINKDKKIIPVNLVPAYMDLSRGIWNISLDSYCFKVIEPAQLETVYEISATLCTTLEFGENQRQSSGLATLGHIDADCPKDRFLFAHFEQKWFTVDNPNSTHFEVYCKAIDMTKQDNAEIELEITILFQRQM